MYSPRCLSTNENEIRKLSKSQQQHQQKHNGGATYYKVLGSNFQMTLRFFILFIISLVLSELSGFSSALNDSFSSVSLHFTTTTSSPPTILPDNKSILSSTTSTSRSSKPSHKLISDLYKDYNNLSTVYELQKEQFSNIKNANTNSSFKKPKFSIDMYWTKENIDIRVCQLHNVCLRNDGILLIDSGLKKHSSKLRDCQFQNFEYVKDFKKVYTEDDPTSKINLFGSSPARYHIPHFLTDVLPILYSSELVYPTKKHESVHSECFLTKQYHSYPCPKNEKADFQKEYFGIFVENRVMKMKLSDWVPQFSAMINDNSVLISKESVLADITLGPRRGESNNTNNDEKYKAVSTQNSKTCFKSIVSFPRHLYYLRSSEWFSENGNELFSKYGLVREPTATMEANSYKQKRGSCDVNIVIMNRRGWEKRHGLYLGRDLMNIEEIYDTIINESKSKNIIPHISVSYFENMTFSEQVILMQKADILIGVHGAGLSNMIFAKRNTPLIEIFPFTYYAGPFNGLSLTLGISYYYMISEPDTKTFIQCVDYFSKKKNDTSISQHAKEIWIEALKERKLNGELEFLKTHTFTDPVGSHLKMCARTQRLKVDPAEITGRVLKLAQKRCNKS